ncbi:MAG: sigma-54-dependent Fis family transcriptional regulator [Myxococcales bacterium]|nr:sigma-54-dependent Fis family transcriptional regulator [Myxococcales bacterium]
MASSSSRTTPSTASAWSCPRASEAGEPASFDASLVARASPPSAGDDPRARALRGGLPPQASRARRRLEELTGVAGDEPKGRILVSDDEPGLREMLRVLLRRRGYDVTLVDGVRAALAHLGADPPYDAVVTDLRMPDGSGLEVLEAAREKSESTQVIVITAFAATDRAVEAMRLGAYDFLEKPFKNDVLLATLEKALEKHDIVRENRALRDHLTGKDSGLIGVSDVMQELRRLIARAADAPTSVLITGESGTGKELVARALHTQSSRRERAFVTINCGALPEQLMESELFGHEKGAFTGAAAKKDGLFRAAEGGTLFLDEVGELPLPLQVKLLRALQERKVRPVGSEREHPVDVRVVAATNRDLEAEVREGRFREDLYYRLNVIRMTLPPLRDRPEDVRPLAEHLLHKHATFQRRSLRLGDEALRWLAAQPFPGNVRELENLVERAVALAPGPEIDVEDLAGRRPPPTPGTGLPRPLDGPLPDPFDLDAHLAEIEKRILLQALEQRGGVRKHAAKLLGMTFRSFRYRLAKYGLGGDEEDE